LKRYLDGLREEYRRKIEEEKAQSYSRGIMVPTSRRT
jgi:hypothetical protein